ncbi:DNA-protecting protein DprA [Bacillus timonensis]|uniref:DNA-protecting protein DprA n=1 Tax=Bacillus timonensis TaxID=1033734 RepID=A0A4S3PXF5_9BACI|nr:DNA-processing protein DprA [Bacillus timonensis]THE14458.1 DNA-protecting protein DprA [Bacillus timonensis]
MEKFRVNLIHLHHCRGIGWKSIFRILQHDPTLSSIYNYPSSFYEKILPLTKIQLNIFLKDLHSLSIQSMLKQYSNKSVGIITIFDEEYPRLLKQIYDPPWVLYTAGDRALLNRDKLLSVVGSRTPTASCLQSMTKVLVPLLKQNWVLVSGLARGIDTMAHRLAIAHNGKTIAVIAGGLQHIYPLENKELATTITQNHILISEYPPFTRPEKWQFPMRNRIISGLTQGTLVVEAKERSGSLITADQALHQGREVFAIPGSILEPSCVGTNKLIQSGAKLVLTSEDILSEIHTFS